MNVTALCRKSEEYHDYLPLRATEAVAGGLAIPAFVMLVYTAVTRKHRVVTSSLHFNFKLLLYNIWLILACQVLFDIFSCSYMLVQSTFLSDYCSHLFTVWQCFLIRGPVLWAIPAMTLAHAAALLERTMATRHSADYEKRGKSVGIATMIVMWIVGAIVNYNVFVVDDMFGKLSYCNATVPKNQDRVKIMLICLLPIELLITAGDIGLWWINRRDQKQTISCRIYTNYSLSKSFQQSENYLTSRLVLPISLVHSSLYMVYLTVTASFRSAYGYDSDPKAFVVGIMLVNGILTIGITVCIMTYVWCVRKMESDRRLREIKHGTKKNTEIYFKMLNSQIK